MVGDKLANGETPVDRKNRLLSLAKIHGEKWLELKCAMWTVELMNSDYKKRSIPIKPQEVLEFEVELPINERRKLDKSFYRDNPIIEGYYSRKNKVKVENDSSEIWLKNVLRVFLEHGKSEEANRVIVRIEEFKEKE